MKFLSKQRSKKILSIATPSGLNSLLDIINISIDLLLVGTLGASFIVAVGVSLNYIMLVFAITTIVFVGNSALVARFIGEGHQKEANIVVSSLSFASLLIALPTMFLSFLFYDTFFIWMGISQEAKMLGDIYLKITLFSIPLLLIKQVSISAFSAAAYTKIPFIIKIFITFLNAGLKYSLIFGFLFLPELGLKGAAIATLIINFIETLALFACLLLLKNSPISLGKKINFNYIKRAFIIGFPSGCERFFTLISILLMAKFVASYGTINLAGYQIATRIEGFAFMPGFGFMIAAMALMGQNLGAKKPLEAKYSILNTLFLGGCFMGIMGILMSVFAYPISYIFNKDSQIILASASYLIPLGLSQIPLAFIFILDGALRGAGITKITLFTNAIMIWGLRVIPCYFIAKFQYPIIYIYICISLETFLRAFVYWRIFRICKWRHHKV
ncbi:MATE family efflux transporter [Helicobacter burdigaliensis]|uniref:MATE family efflux transporter n=1 Tax=Helicobacter burdigaliensis TaxID=2315334 RepID=UPI000EF6ADE2|nr:MATE family efflux transporter [Helicobacter burdigaliensis]